MKHYHKIHSTGKSALWLLATEYCNKYLTPLIQPHKLKVHIEQCFPSSKEGLKTTQPQKPTQIHPHRKQTPQHNLSFW